MYREFLFVSNVGEVKDHRDSAELVAPLVHDGSSSRDDGLGEVIVEWHPVFSDGHGRVAVEDERWKS